MVPFETILVPVDLSDCSRKAFHLACSVARQHGARLFLLHVDDAPLSKVTYGGIPVEIRPADHHEKRREALHEWQSAFPEVPVEYLLKWGDPVEEIIRTAQDLRCDLIVMGTHGRLGLRRLVLGSVAEQVLRQASCPVLLVKGTTE